ncbi:glycosyltransferase [Kocuria sp. UBA1838]|uniref:glycosyltransferase n=1 Tax=Kocuria sp. UBA1838 TaxID=1946673 RepID=UPI00257B8C4C|nr:glycosyltransferase [Kocuria sp. UBA1838]
MVEHPQPPLVDIVIPVHSTSRPLQRAVSSALRAAPGAALGQCRVTAVAHHLTAEQVHSMLSVEQRAVVDVIESEDRGSTAAVPRNEALRRTSARYISFLDSDDTLDPGAVTRWLGIAERRGSDLVMPFQHHENPRVDITPIVRPLRRSDLDPVKDRLGYRSTAFGLIRMSAVRRTGARFDESARTGEDQSFVMALYAGAHRIDLAPGLPGVLMHADGTDRVSRQLLPIRETVAAALDLGREPWFAGVPDELKRSYILKYIRVNFFPALEHAVRSGTWDAHYARSANAVFGELTQYAPHVTDQLSRADLRVARLLSPGAGERELLAALAERRRYTTPGALLTERWTRVLGRQAPLRVIAASAVQMLRYRWALAAGSRN